MADKWPLVGRRDELESIAKALADESVRALVLAGPEGVGKTRLATEGLGLAGECDVATARVLATRSAARLPLGAFAPLLPPAVESQDPSADVLRSAQAAITTLGAGSTLVLLVDDAHLLDDLSAALVWQLAESGAAMVIATVRIGETVPDPIVALWKEEIGERIEVQPLSVEDMRELLPAVLGGPVDPRAVRVLADHSRGNPLYLRELVTAALDTHILRRDADAWRLVGALPLSQRLVELVEARIGSLGEAEREVVELVAYGEPLAVGTLSSDEGAAIAVLERRGLISVATEGRRTTAMLAHPLYGDVVRARTPKLTARAVNARLADLVERVGGRRREDPLRFAQWRVDGGGTAQPALMLRAAQQARNRADLPLARRLAQAAIDAGAGFEGRLLAAQLTVLDGNAERAEALFERLTTCAETDAQRATAAIDRINNLLVGLARPEAALRVAVAAAREISDAKYTDELARVRAQILYHLGQSGAALAVAEPIVDRVSGRTLIELAPTAAAVLMEAGRLTQALDVAQRGYDAHLSWNGPLPTFGPHTHLVARGVTLVYLGRLAEAEDEARRGYAGAVVTGSVEAQANFAQLLGWVLTVRGRATAGAQSMAESLALYRKLGWKVYVMFALANLAYAEALRGDSDAAVNALAELEDLHVPEAHDLGNPLVAQARAWVAVAQGDLASARDHLAQGADEAGRGQNRVLEALLLHDHVRLGRPADVADRLAELSEVVEGDLARAWAEHSAALCARDPLRLEAVAREFERLGAWLFAAEAAAGAAVAASRAGERRRATLLERSAAALARRCEGAVTPALQSIETQAILSARELEVASLAAAGLSNRAIAERLYVSVRTVETQLQHVYEKLGVSRRGDLPHALHSS